MQVFLISEKWPQTCPPYDNSFLRSESQGEVISIQICRAGAHVSALAGETPAARAGPGTSQHFCSSLGKPPRSVGIVHAGKHSMGGRWRVRSRECFVVEFIRGRNGKCQILVFHLASQNKFPCMPQGDVVWLTILFILHYFDQPQIQKPVVSLPKLQHYDLLLLLVKEILLFSWRRKEIRCPCASILITSIHVQETAF